MKQQREPARPEGLAPLEEVFRNERASALCRMQPAIVSPDASLSEAIESLKGDSGGAVLVVETGAHPPVLAGIFTERDYLDKVASGPARSPGGGQVRIRDLMTRNPRTLRDDATLDAAIALMTAGGYRHLPLVDRDGRLTGLLSVRDIIVYLAELFPTDVMNLPPQLPTSTGSREGE